MSSDARTYLFGLIRIDPIDIIPINYRCVAIRGYAITTRIIPRFALVYQRRNEDGHMAFARGNQ